MKILVAGINNLKKMQLAERFTDKLKEKYLSVDIWPENQCVTNADIKEREIDLLITFDLQGFQYLTLTDGIAYNLLDCKQIHFLMGRDLQNEQYLKKQLSIAMFFFCVDKGYCDSVADKYPDIPYLEWMDVGVGVSEMQDAMEEAVAKVVEMCRL